MRRFLPLIILLGVIFLLLFGTFKKNTRVIPTPLIGQEVPLLGLEVEFYEDFEDNNLVEISEISDHPFMIGSQFHPEFGSRLDRPHPLFDHFIKASANQKKTGAQFQL